MSGGKKREQPKAEDGPEYPEHTSGSQLAREARDKANQLTEQQREELFRRGMRMIYGGGSDKEKISSR